MQLYEQDLIKKSIEGDREAFSKLLDAYYSIIFRIAYKWCASKEDAEDIAQETCIKIGQSISDFKGDAKFSSWVYRIVINTANDFYRKHQKPVSDYNIEDVESQALSATDIIQSNQLWQMVRKLPEKQRDAVMLIYAEELSHFEASQIMQCAESTVSWHVMEAKKQLKDMLK